MIEVLHGNLIGFSINSLGWTIALFLLHLAIVIVGLMLLVFTLSGQSTRKQWEFWADDVKLPFWVIVCLWLIISGVAGDWEAATVGALAFYAFCMVCVLTHHKFKHR